MGVLAVCRGRGRRGCRPAPATGRRRGSARRRAASGGSARVAPSLPCMVAIEDDGRALPLPVGGVVHVPGADRPAADGLAEHPGLERRGWPRSAARVGAAGAGGTAAGPRRARAPASSRRAGAAGSRTSDRGGQVGEGEDDHADQHADVGRAPRDPGPPTSCPGTASEACLPWLGSQRTRISSPTTVTTHHSAEPDDADRRVPAGESSGAIRNAVQTTSASTPATVCSVEQPVADVEPAGALAAAHPQPGEHHDDRREGGQHVDDHGQRHGRSVPYGAWSSPRTSRTAGVSATRLTCGIASGVVAVVASSWRGQPVEQRVHLATSGSRGRPARTAPGAGRRRAAARRPGRSASGRSSYASAIGAPRPAATTATPPMTSTTSTAKNHIMAGHRSSRASTIIATASSTSSVSDEHVEVGLG